MELDLRVAAHVEHADTAVESQIEAAELYARTDTPEQVDTVHAVVAVDALGGGLAVDGRMALARECHLELRAGEQADLDIGGKVEMIAEHHGDAHAEFADGHVDFRTQLAVAGYEVVHGIGVIEQLDPRLDIEVGHKRDVVDAAKLYACAVAEHVDAEWPGLDIAGTGDVGPYTHAEICAVGGIVEDGALSRSCCKAEEGNER